ncbi:heparan-alpha-glucosaminide N-acetyltransferase domain-containing protein [Streptomyces sp. DSM 44917]|uniref:Heparan-alpha-glucosaminide N-acetyltransferase domain-containing protein n=1 Tax=Streptomyces boetiae TaxID=3075541 RepID=A0ABU2L9V2_9ACTN|nr:heparan-alpha-glucosaminide N-acetyltransferase domain-containing protein [Streptomyces sp. DSM 44917]MDT0308343.1 heparan-alpha-glucosaminide N-acetyltransferase domain-containing protein [Streptomyces sp. DSM 44917]
MTQNSAAIAPSEADTGREAARLLGLDLARGLAVFGMYTAHLARDPGDGVRWSWLIELSHGRSSALFAVLAGVTLVFLTGRQGLGTGREGLRSVVRVAIRSGVLLVLGTLLTLMGTPIAVILPYFALYFLLALPFARLRARTLAAVAVATAAVGPQYLFALRQSAYGPYGEYTGWAETMDEHDPLARLGADGALDLLVTGNYPVLAWMPLIFAGMALGRLDLASAVVRARLLVIGPALAALGYGGSWLAFRLVPSVVETTGAPSAWWSDAEIGIPGSDPVWLLIAAPHTETSFAVVGNAGVAVLVIAAALVALDRWPALTRAGTPVILVGSMSLSAYVGHLLAIEAFGLDELDRPLSVPLAFMVVAGALAWLWRRYVGRRGPLEEAMHALTRATPLK